MKGYTRDQGASSDNSAEAFAAECRQAARFLAEAWGRRGLGVADVEHRVAWSAFAAIDVATGTVRRQREQVRAEARAAMLSGSPSIQLYVTMLGLNRVVEALEAAWNDFTAQLEAASAKKIVAARTPSRKEPAIGSSEASSTPSGSLPDDPLSRAEARNRAERPVVLRGALEAELRLLRAFRQETELEAELFATAVRCAVDLDSPAERAKWRHHNIECAARLDLARRLGGIEDELEGWSQHG